MKRKFSLAYLTIPGVEPLTQIQIASEAGYDYVSLRTIPMGLPGEPQVCLEKDPQLFKEIKQALKTSGLKLFDIELVRVREDLPEDFRKAFECGAELGATDVLSSVWTKDHGFAVEQYGKICEQAKEFGLTVNLEFPIVSGVTTLADTLAIQDKVNAPNLKLLMDMIYCHWDNVTADVIKKIDKSRFGVIHLCDCPKDPQGLEIPQIVREAREYCGEGVVHLEELLKALPENTCSIELPNTKYIAEYGAAEHARRCLSHAKALFKKEG